MVEYIIIVVIIAIAALAIFGLFSDTIRKKLAGATSTLDEDKGQQAQSALNTDSEDILKQLGAEGLED